MKRHEIKANYSLTEKQKETLKDKYYNSEIPTTDLIKEFGLNGLPPSQLTYLFEDIVTDIKCEYCLTLMCHKPPTRTSTRQNLFCPSCRHIVYYDHHENCSCLGCKAKQKQIIQNLISDNRNIPKIYYDYLTAWEKVIIGSMHCFGRSVHDCIAWSGHGCDYNLLPSSEKTEELIEDLIESRYLVLSNHNNLNNFIFQENNNKIVFGSDWGYKVLYDLWMEETALEKLEIGMIFTCEDEQDKEEELYDIWIKINRDEAINFLLTIFEKYYIVKYKLDEIEHIIDNYVEKFSLLQILNVIKYVTKQPAQDIALSDKKTQARIKAGYDIINHLKNYFNWAIQENYVVKEIDINSYNFSMITEYFYYKVLQQDDRGFSLIPNKSNNFFRQHISS